MAQQRIIEHMNKDHRIALEDYLVSYGNVVMTDKIAHIHMSAIELDHMTISFNHFDVEHTIEKPITFEPPLSDWKEARERLVEMAKFAASKRNLSHIQINEMRGPYPAQWVLLVVIFLPLWCWLIPGLYAAIFEKIFPHTLYEIIHKNLLNIQIVAALIHVGECYFLLKHKLDYYRVPIDFKLEWYFFGALEGFGAVKRLNDLIRERTT